MKEKMTPSRSGKGKWMTGTASVLAMSYVAAWAWNSFVKTFPKEVPYTDQKQRAESADKLTDIMETKDREEAGTKKNTVSSTESMD